MELFASNVEERAHRQVSQQIKHLIAARRLRKGDLLPSYDEMCEKFNVCPVTLKRALDELYKEQLIFSRRGKGIFVNRELSRSRTLTLIGLVYSYSHQTFFTSPYLMEIFQGIMLEADAAGAGVRAFSIKATQKRERRLLGPSDLEEGGVDGAILLSVHN
ncbi:MAG TPA: GntR family transcriptional regulator, partial [Planctomycetota bacterium]|nr:GntR family transcriptional regulator [Planctomycetota bacterium]